ncbi:MAG: phenylalanine--tRNA ligase subunit alpha, partial [Candidatus Liptonbacteria bacterium]
MAIDIHGIKKALGEELVVARTAHELESLRVKYLGRKGELTALLKTLKDLPIEERRTVGPALQSLRAEIEEKIAERADALAKEGNAATKKRIDLTAPGRRPERGHVHLLSIVEKQVREIFTGLNFSTVEGPELETEYYNFDALNIPKDHPARDMWDTFWIKEGVKNSDQKNSEDRLLLRTHTSPVQVRYMEAHTPPFQIIVPGRVSRYEATDMTHEAHFLNLEGLMVGKDITLANFKFVIEAFFKKFFGKQMKFRYRPSYFPFVEPGVEVDIFFKGKWLEVMGAGMVHPRVFEYARYNPREWQGFAFGMGVERLTMI